MTREEIQRIFNELNIATVEFWEASKLEDEAKLVKQAKYKKLQMARAEANSVKFD